MSHQIFNKKEVFLLKAMVYTHSYFAHLNVFDNQTV